VIGSSIPAAWRRVRDNNDTTVNWILCGYFPHDSKSNVEVVAQGPGDFEDLKKELLDPKYASQCLFGGFRENEKFAHFTWVGVSTGGMAKGRASLHKNAILNELEGCVHEENIIQGENDNAQPAAAAEVPTTIQATPPAQAPNSGSAEQIPKATQFELLAEEEFVALFAMSKDEFLRLPTWKQTNLRKAKNLF
jgi:hypothetical protein